MQARTKRLSASLPEPLAPLKLLSSDMLYQNGYRTINLMDVTWRDKISEVFAKHEEMGVLILDNLSCLLPGIEENNKEAWDHINQWLLTLRFQGVAVIYLHHAGKSGEQRGTSGREDALDVSIRLSSAASVIESGKTGFFIVFEKLRGIRGDKVSPNTIFEITEEKDGNLIWTTNHALSDVKRGPVLSLLVEGRTPQEIVERLTCSKQLVSKYKKEAIEKGFLIEHAKGKYMFSTEGELKYGIKPPMP